MSKIFIVLMMIFCHIVDDYYLQKGLLNCLKQKSWWREQDNYKSLYKYDYIVGLIVHSFSWAFMIMLPIAFVNSFEIGAIFLITFVLNMVIHAVVDDLKANKFKTNLILDQTIHLIQIIITAVVLL